MFAIDLSIPSKIICSPNEIEVIVVQIFTNNPITLCLVYNPPNSTITYQQNLLNFLTTIMQSNDNVFILGDFNITCQILDGHLKVQTLIFQFYFVTWSFNTTFPR